MQQATPMVPMMPSFPPSNITTEQIQKYLDDNKKLILAIMENQNLGKLAECAQYQAQLQKNLMYLAAIADAQPQPQTPTIPSQITPHPVMQQGGFYLQHPQAAAMAQQHPIFSQKTPPQFNPPHPMQDHHHQQQQAIQGQMSMRLGGPHNPTHPASSGAATLPAPVGPSDVRGGNKKDAPDSGAGASGTDGQGGSAAGHGGGGVETSYPKGSEGAK